MKHQKTLIVKLMAVAKKYTQLILLLLAGTMVFALPYLVGHLPMTREESVVMWGMCIATSMLYMLALYSVGAMDHALHLVTTSLDTRGNSQQD